MILAATPAVVAQPEEPAVLPLGDVVVVSGPEGCDGEECWMLEVACPEVVEAARVTLRVGEGEGEGRGTVLFMSGGGGTGLWGGSGPARGALEEVREAGFRTVQLVWEEGWLVGAEGALEGHARLACRPATVADWVHRTFHGGDPAETLCATGNSGGSAQVSYMLARYGLEGILDLAVPTAGPPMGRIDLGCLREDGGPERLWYAPGSAALIDRGFGFSQPGTGPCATGDPAFEEPMAAASVVAEGGDYRYPRTAVWFVFGTTDRSNAVPQGLLYFQRLARALSPLLHLEFLPGVPHAVHASPRGARRITEVVLAECREH